MGHRLTILFLFLFIFNAQAQKDALINETDSIRLYDTYLSINSTENMFPSFYGEGLIYSSTHKSNSYSPFYSDLQSKSKKIKIGARFFLGPVAVFDQEIYFTGNSRSMTNGGFYNLTIYKGSFDNLKVSKARELPILNKNFEYSHPAISKEGDMMIVVSNEKGSYHLLELIRNENDEWERGEIIFIAQPNFMLLNPTIYDKNTIYFSSNFFKGKIKEVKRKFENGKLTYTEIYREKGVFNIYKVVKEKGIWQLPKKAYEFNSEFDDLGVIFKTEKSGYLTTFRYNNTDNIYYFELK
jgi:hypothetical protein